MKDNQTNDRHNIKPGWRFQMGGAPGDRSWFSVTDAKMQRARRGITLKA